MHHTHKTRMSDSSFYDEVCVKCGITDANPHAYKPCTQAERTDDPFRGPIVSGLLITAEDLLG